jgi:hypothetical protein
MKKIFFLTLTLIALSVASVNAQVRIGGTDTPHTSAVLDLNADNAVKAGSLGLALPRVELETNLDELNGTEPAPGTIVYNSAATLEGEGVYVWTKQWGSAGGPVPVSGVFITNSRVNLTTAAGAALRLSAVVFPANATNQNLTWSIKNQNPISGSGDVATIDPITGVLIGIQGGDLVAQVEALGGSDVLDEINVSVTGPAGSVSGTSGTEYALYYYGEQIGTWMIDNLKEGDPTYSGSSAPGTPPTDASIIELDGEIGFFYGVAARASSCPETLRIPNVSELFALAGALSGNGLALWMGDPMALGTITGSGAYGGPQNVYWGAEGQNAVWRPATTNTWGVSTENFATHVRCMRK